MPLIVSMGVAILTAKLGDIHGVFDLVVADEFTYLVVLVMLAILGPGHVAIDHIIAKRLDQFARWIPPDIGPTSAGNGP